MRTERRTAVACFGEALVDLLAEPAAPGSPRRFIEHAGGAPANVAVGVARLGGDARFVGTLAHDMFGDFLLSELHRYGVDCDQVRRSDDAPTALAFVSLDAQGERSFCFYRPPSADLLFTAGDFDDGAFPGVAVFHACSNSLTEPCIAAATMHGLRQAREAGALVSFDLNFRPALWPRASDPLPVVWPALEQAQLVKLSAEEWRLLAGPSSADEVLARLFAHAARVVVVTDGAAPIHWFTRSDAGTASTLAVTAIDTTAAGDAFVAGLLHGLVSCGVTGTGDEGAGNDGAGEALEAAFADASLRDRLLREAAASGAFATTRRGAFAAMPTTEQRSALLEHRA